MFRRRDPDSTIGAGTLAYVRHGRLATVGFAAALVLAACSGGGESEVSAAGDSDSDSGSSAAAAIDPIGPAPPAGPPAVSIDDIDVPDVDVFAVPSGKTVNVAELAHGQDTLFWFYAPH